MASAAAKKAKEPTRAELCRELLEIERDNAALFTRIDAIKAQLKLSADSIGSFRETIAGLGHVSVSPPAAPKFKGDFPVVVVDAWKALKPLRQDRLLEDGIVKIESQYSGAYYGRVDVKLYSPPQGASK